MFENIKKLLLISMFLLTGCDLNSSSSFSMDNFQTNYDTYNNYRENYFYGKQGDWFYLDFEKDVFLDGLIVDKNNKTSKINEVYNDVFIIAIDEFRVLEYEKVGTFEVKIKYPEFNAPIYFYLINHDTKIKSERMLLGYVYGLSEEVIEIDELSDFNELTLVDQTLILTNHLDFSNYEGKWNPLTIRNTTFLNPNNYEIRNFNIQNIGSKGYVSIFNYARNCYFDNLIIKDTYLDFTLYEEQEFVPWTSGLVASASGCVFKNIKIDNFKVLADNRIDYIGGIVNQSYDCSYINNNIEVDIIQNGEVKIDENEKPKSIGGLASFDYRVFIDEYESFKLFGKGNDNYRMPIRYNKVIGKIQGVDYVGGLFGNIETLRDDSMIIDENITNIDMLSNTDKTGEFFGGYTNWSKVNAN